MKMLMQKKTFCLYVPTPTLEMRADMEPVEMTAEQIAKHNAGIPAKLAKAAQESSPVVNRPYNGSHTTLKVGEIVPAKSKVVSIGAMTEAELRALAAEKNINLKNAKSVEKIRKTIMDVLIPEPVPAPVVKPAKAPVPAPVVKPAKEPVAQDEELT